MTAEIETHTFQAETQKLLDLMIHSLYTQKEIFLRELVSNASDAIDRLRFESLTNPELLGEEDQLEIRLDADPEARTLTVSDNGIGMSRDEVQANIGTIARSGNRELLEQIQRGEGPAAEADGEVGQLIGQFGVGFYSAFMVADRVTLTTRRAGEDSATRWESTGDGRYTLADAERGGRGTTIVLHLKDTDPDVGLEDFTERWVVSRIVKRYSDFVTYPILWKDRREEVEKDEDGKEIEGGETRTVLEDITLNSRTPIWTRPSSEVTEEEYAEFFKHISRAWTEPLRTLHFKAEGRIEYQALLFIPKEAPSDLYYVAHEYGLRLYVRRVMVMERCEDLVPRYLRFVQGVVDSSDLPLNISRQRLQEDRHIALIRKWLTKKILEALAALQAEDAAEYRELWNHFGKALKEGLSSDFDNKDKLLALTLFHSSQSADELTTLESYVERMKDDQEEIFYLTGESRAAVENSPHLEAFKAKEYEVLYLIDPVDELMVQHLFDYQGKKLKSVGKGTVELGSGEEKEEAAKEVEEKSQTFNDLMERMQKHLDEHIKQVRLSNRLTSSPACLVGADHDYSPQMEKLLQMGKGAGPRQRRILELNPDHPLLEKLQTRFDGDADDALIGDYAELLMGYALLAEGSELLDPVRFNQLVADVMVARL